MGWVINDTQVIFCLIYIFRPYELGEFSPFTTARGPILYGVIPRPETNIKFRP